MDKSWFKALHYLTILFHVAVGSLLVYFGTQGDEKAHVRNLAIVLGVVSLLSLTPFTRKQKVVDSKGRTLSWSNTKVYHFLTIGYHLLTSVSLLVLGEDDHLDYWSVALGGLLVVVSLMSIYPIAKNDYSITRAARP